jgi:hypothetical protein
MGFLDFLRCRVVQVPEAKKAPPQPQPISAQGDLIFKSSIDALEYVQKFAPVAWRPNIVLIAMIGGEVELIKGTLCAIVLAPKDNGFAQLTTFTSITAVHSRESGRVPVEATTSVSATRLKHSDLVMLHLADRKPELIDLLPDNYDGWVAFITAKILPIFSLKDGGWRIECKYEL